MNDPTDLPIDRIPVSVPPASGVGTKPDPLLDGLPAGLLPPPKPATPPAHAKPSGEAAHTKPSKGHAHGGKTTPAEGEAAKPAGEPATAAVGPVVGAPPPQPRWVKEAVRDLLKWNRKKTAVLSAAGSLVAGALALNALFTGVGRGPAHATEQPAAPQPLAEVAAAPPPAQQTEQPPPPNDPSDRRSDAAPNTIPPASSSATSSAVVVPAAATEPIPVPTAPAGPPLPVPLPVPVVQPVSSVPASAPAPVDVRVTSSVLPADTEPRSIPRSDLARMVDAVRDFAADWPVPPQSAKFVSASAVRPPAPAVSVEPPAAVATAPPVPNLVPPAISPVEVTPPSTGAGPLPPPAVIPVSATDPAPQSQGGGAGGGPTLPAVAPPTLPAGSPTTPAPVVPDVKPAAPATPPGSPGQTQPAPVPVIPAPSDPKPQPAHGSPNQPKQDTPLPVPQPPAPGDGTAGNNGHDSTGVPGPKPSTSSVPAVSDIKLPQVAPPGEPTPPATNPAVNPAEPPKLTPFAPVSGGQGNPSGIRVEPDRQPTGDGARHTNPGGSAPAAATLTMTKPSGTADVRTVASQEPARTDFDVDLHEPKATDTYDSISKLHYGDAKYAAALRAFNQSRGLDLGRGVPLQVPPMYILRKQYSRFIGQTRSPAPPPTRDGGRGLEWGSPTADRPAPPANVYVVPRAGMTLKDVAEELYGDRQQWGKVWDVNPRVEVEGKLDAGTKLNLPPDAKPKK